MSGKTGSANKSTSGAKEGKSQAEIQDMVKKAMDFKMPFGSRAGEPIGRLAPDHIDWLLYNLDYIKQPLKRNLQIVQRAAKQWDWLRNNRGLVMFSKPGDNYNYGERPQTNQERWAAEAYNAWQDIDLLEHPFA